MTPRKFAAFAHRGGGFDANKHGFAENTVAAFQYALEQGFTYLETDVRASMDGTLYAWHGSGLERLLPSLAVDDSKFNQPGGPVVNTLEEILRVLPQNTCLSVDIKHDRAIKPLAHAIIKTNAYSRVLLGSFLDKRAAKVAKLVYAQTGQVVPTAIGGITTFPALWWRSKTKPSKAWHTDAQAIWAPYKLVTPAFVQMVHATGLPVYVWTVNNKPAMEAMLDLSVDGMVTDELAMLKELLQLRNYTF